jgi:hypothetical protein
LATVEVVIKTIDQSRGGVSGLTNNLGQLALKYVSLGAVAGAAYKVIGDSVKTTLEYANSVRQLSTISGESTESTSRFLQVLDDYKISAADALVATRALTKAGHTPSIETLGRLSDEYLSLNGAQAKNEFILKNLGRGGLQWVEVLNKGSTALLAQGNAVNSNLILTQKMVDAARKNEIAVDNWNDSVQGLKIALGNQLLPVLTDFVNGLNAGAAAQDRFAESGERVTALSARFVEVANEERAAQEAAAEAMLSHAEAMDTQEASAEELKEQLDAINQKNEQFIGVLGDVKGSLEAYRTGVAEAKAALAEGSITTDEYRTRVEGLGAAYEETKNKIILSIIEMKLASEGWTDAELNSYLQIGEQLGVFDSKMVATTNSYITQANNLVNATDEIDEPMLHLGERAVDTAEDFGYMTEMQYALANGLRKGANPAVNELKKVLSGLPKSGTAWNYFFSIITSGKVPKLPQVGSYTPGVSTGQSNAAMWLAANSWTGGPLNDKGFTIVGDTPGGGWGPHTEVIFGDYVFNAEEARMLRDAGLLDNATAMAGGTTGGRRMRRTGRSTGGRVGARSVSRTGMGRRNTATMSGSRGVISDFYSGTGTGAEETSVLASDTAAVAADTASQAVNVAGIAAQESQNIATGLQASTFQNVQAQQQTQQALAIELQEIQRILNKQPTRDDAFNAARYGQQTAI